MTIDRDNHLRLQEDVEMLKTEVRALLTIVHNLKRRISDLELAKSNRVSNYDRRSDPQLDRRAEEFAVAPMKLPEVDRT